MPDYAKTIIYKLINYDYPDLVYVGSTTNFTKRKQHHKENTLNTNSQRHHLKVYETIRKNGGWESWNMIKICDFPCKNRREAEHEEDKYMLELKSKLNTIRAFRTIEQYREEEKDKIKEMNKNYYEANKAKILDKQKVKVICDCGFEGSKNHFKRHQQTSKHIELMKCI